MVERKCPVCNTTYLADPGRLKYGRQTTCSRKCSYEMRAQGWTTSTTFPCAGCGTPVIRSPSLVRAKTGLVFCSPKCHYEGRSTGLVSRIVTTPYDIPQETRDRSSALQTARNLKRKEDGLYLPLSDETKKKLSVSTSKAIAEGRIPRVSKLEISVGVILADLGINAVPQYGIRGDKGQYAACLDFYLPDINAALEVNGTFWHCDPRTYPNGPTHASQIRTLTKYTKKQELLLGMGIRLIEVWEADVQKDPVGAVKAALGLV